MYVCTVCMTGYPSVSCNRIIENKRNKTKKKKKGYLRFYPGIENLILPMLSYPGPQVTSSRVIVL